MQQSRETTMEDIPTELILHILQFLRGKDLIVASSICQVWRILADVCWENIFKDTPLFGETWAWKYMCQVRDTPDDGPGFFIRKPRSVIGPTIVYKYEGNFKDGKKNGMGLLEYQTWRNGTIEQVYSIYKGEFCDGEREGMGICYGEWGFYMGEWKDSMYHGYGILSTTDGRRYEGKRKKTTPSVGVYYYDGDDKYCAGSFFESGHVFIHDKNSYAGKHSLGRKISGVEYYENGTIKYAGEWKSNKYHGLGICYKPNGDIWKEGKWDSGELIICTKNVQAAGEDNHM